VRNVPYDKRHRTFQSVDRSVASRLLGGKASIAELIFRPARRRRRQLSFSVTGPTSTAHFRYIKVGGLLYTLSIETPNAYREAVAAMKDKFFASFKLKGKS
jgi:hypothetical protein